MYYMIRYFNQTRIKIKIYFMKFHTLTMMPRRIHIFDVSSFIKKERKYCEVVTKAAPTSAVASSSPSVTSNVSMKLAIFIFIESACIMFHKNAYQKPLRYNTRGTVSRLFTYIHNTQVCIRKSFYIDLLETRY